MAGLASRVDGIVGGWVHSGVRDEAEQRVQIVFFRVLTVLSFALLIVLPLLLLPTFAAGDALALGAIGCALTLLVAAILCATGSRAAAAGTGLIVAAGAIGALAAASGGAASPFIAWLGFLPLAGVLAGRTWHWLAAGFGAAVAAGVAAAVFGSPMPGDAGMAVAAMLPLAAMLAYAIARLSIVFERTNAAVEADDAKKVTPMREAYDLLPGLVTVHDASGGVIAIHGADAETYRQWLKQPMGRGFFQQIHVGDRLAFMQAIDALRQGRDRVALDLRMHCLSVAPPAEQFVHLHMDLAAIRDEAGALGTILAQSRDVTAEVAMRHEAAEKTVAAESANAAKTRFLAAVSHELRTPLNAIIGFSDVLAEERFGAFANERQREYVGLIRQSGGHLLSVVNSLLDMSRIEAGRYALSVESFEVAAAVKDCEAMLALEAHAKGVLLTSRVSRACGALAADRRAVDQILINLVANAVKFTEKGGVVTIDADIHDDRLRLSVSDTGIGISAENLEVIGEPFVQVQGDSARSVEGAGLGLSLVKGLVALHGGGFAIRSTLGEGTVVTIELARDGSGVVPGRPSDGERTLEFPPRLPAADTVKIEGKLEGYDGAQARTA